MVILHDYSRSKALKTPKKARNYYTAEDLIDSKISIK